MIHILLGFWLQNFVSGALEPALGRLTRRHHHHFALGDGLGLVRIAALQRHALLLLGRGGVVALFDGEVDVASFAAFVSVGRYLVGALREGRQSGFTTLFDELFLRFTGCLTRRLQQQVRLLLVTTQL